MRNIGGKIMFTKKKTLIYSAFVVAVALIVGLFMLLAPNEKNVAQMRSVTLQKVEIDDQSILSEFEDAEMTVEENNVAVFTGTKRIDPSVFEALDLMSASEVSEACAVKYHFTYDAENNVVTLSAEMKNQYGEIAIEEIQGSAFYNEKGEVDAVMNMEGEPVLLSELRDAGMIENCGWFSNLFKIICASVVIVTVAVAAACAIVVTAGAAAPAFVAAGVGAITAATGMSAAAIGTAAAFTALIASGAYLTASVVEKYYPGIGASETWDRGKRIVYAKWAQEKTKQALRDIVRSERSKPNPKVFFRVTQYNQAQGPVQIELTPYSKAVMAANMAAISWSSITAAMTDAESVVKMAFPFLSTVVDKPSFGMPHYHAQYPNHDRARGACGRYIVHSYFSSLIA